MKGKKTNPTDFYSGAYNDLKDTRASSTYMLKVYNYLKELNPAGGRGKLLDVGCSYGDFGQKLMRLGFTVYGVDIRKTHLAQSKKRGLIAKYADVEKGLPFEDSFFDVVFAGEIIEHLYDTTSFVSELSRVTKPHGLVIVTTPNLASLQNRLSLLLGKLPGIVNHLEKSVGHIRYYTFSDLKAQLEGNGLKVVHEDSSNFPFPVSLGIIPGFLKRLAVNGSKIAPHLGYQIVMVARKN